MKPSKRTAAQAELEDPKTLKKAKTGHAPSLQEKSALDSIAAIYWDLNCVAVFEEIVKTSQSEEDWNYYDDMKDAHNIFTQHAVYYHTESAPCNDLSRRQVSFVSTFGWRLFSICALAEVFRAAMLRASNGAWQVLTQIIAGNRRSLEIFARTRGLDWRGPLARHAGLVSSIRTALAPEINLSGENPHHTVQTLNGRLRRPRFQGKTQIHVNESVYEPQKHNNQSHPMLRQTPWQACQLCDGKTPCGCVAAPNPTDLVELIEYPEKGIGIRALAKFKKDEILGEFLGEIDLPKADFKVTLYDLEQVIWDGREHKKVALICPGHLGNWTRFINHSCESSTYFEATVIGKFATTLITADRDISIFEEITVDYGPGYWSNRKCLCGSANCVSGGK